MRNAHRVLFYNTSVSSYVGHGNILTNFRRVAALYLVHRSLLISKRETQLKAYFSGTLLMRPAGNLIRIYSLIIL